MATCGAIAVWCAFFLLAVFASLGMSQRSGSQLTPSPDNCTAFNATAPCNFPDLADKVYCLSNGSSVVGFCNAQEAICLNRVSLERDSTLCGSSSTTRSTSTTTRSPFFPGGSGGSSFSTEEPIINTGENTAAMGAQISHHAILAFGFIAMAYSTQLFALL